MGRDSKRTRINIDWLCFNPRARMGRDVELVKTKRIKKVSIHAPAWGATSD